MMAMLAVLWYALMTDSIKFLCPSLFALNASLTTVSVTQLVRGASCMPMMNKDGTDIIQRSVWPANLYDVPLICLAKRCAPR